MRDSSVKTVHSILPPTSFFYRTIGEGNIRGFASRVDQAMDVLRTDDSTVNGVECDPSLPCAQFACPHVKWCSERDAIDHVGPSYPPASNDPISALQLFGFVQHDNRFP
ncbi:hypothetical protein TNCV_3222901 [Trichonephila clavipes]|nr:hypothetical protein TNCV_3222901 [Trichonephila clavipes]